MTTVNQNLGTNHHIIGRAAGTARRPRSARWLAAAAVGALLVAGGGVTGAQSASAAVGCEVDYQITSQWQGGFGASVTVKSLGDPVNEWRLAWNFISGQTITQMWNGSYIQSGTQVTVANTSWNGTLATGSTASFGFNSTSGSSNPVPSSFTLNGTACTGQVSVTPTPTTSTTPTIPTTPGGPGLIDNNFTVTREAAYGTSNKFTVLRPSQVSGTMPVLVFGNGGCQHSTSSAEATFLTQVASRGIVVVQEGAVSGSYSGVSNGSPIPTLLTDAITWAQSENARSGATLAGHLDLSKVTSSGFSCGGIEALVASADARVKSVVSLNSGLFSDGSLGGYKPSELAKLHSPIMFMDGGSSDIAYPQSQANYKVVTVPAVLAEQTSAGHGGLINGSATTEAAKALVQFMDSTLNGNTAARAYLVGSSGLASKSGWIVQSKNGF